MPSPIPNWLRLWFQDALIGEIYPEIKAIAVLLTDTGVLTVRYYLDREPIGFDYESVEMVVSEILSNTTNNNDIKSVVEECCFSKVKLLEIDRLGGLVFARSEVLTKQ